MKTYNIETPIKDWVLTHKNDMFYDILEECEKEVNSSKESVTVAVIRSFSGVTYFNLPTLDSITQSLSKCIKYFVENEEYELAARARDCSLAWMNKEYIKKNPK
jgi:hypothetical protein